MMPQVQRPLPDFATVIEREDVQAELTRLACDAWSWEAPQHIRVRPLKVHRRRCT